MEPVLRRSDRLGPDALSSVLSELAPRLAGYLAGQRWFRAKGRVIARVALADVAPLAPLSGDGLVAALALLDVAYGDAPGETYLLPVVARRDAAARELPAGEARPLARVVTRDGDAVLSDGLDDPAVCMALLRYVEDAARIPATSGAFVFDRTPVFSQAVGGVHPAPIAGLHRLRGEQSNTSILFDDRLVLKIFRRIEAGENPDLEVSRFLTLKARFDHVPRLAGFAQYQREDAARAVAVLTTFVPNEGDAWTWTLGALRDFYAAVESQPAAGTSEGALAVVTQLAEGYLQGARRLGEITGALHAALASDPDDPAFAPEPVTPADLQAWSDAIDRQIDAALAQLGHVADAAAASPRSAIERLLGAASDVRARIPRAMGRLLGAPIWKARTHGDYHLGQVLRVAGTGDFVVLDFEGEPARPLAERRGKHSPLRDVAGMLRSFTYASYAGLFEAVGPDPDRSPQLASWRGAWETAAGDAFLAGYLAATVGRGVKLVPADPDVRAVLLWVFCLERAAYELSYELNNRPAWLGIPLAAFEQQLAA